MVTRCPKVVEARRFHQAWFNAQANLNSETSSTSRMLRFGNTSYRILARLGWSDACETLLATRVSIFPERVVLHLGLPDVPGFENTPNAQHSEYSDLAQAYAALNELQALEAPGSAYYSQRLPQPVAFFPASSKNAACLVTRHIPGTWGTLEQYLRKHRSPLDARHGIWIWRRILDTLLYLHDLGWVHGDLHPGHVLLQPQDHCAFLLGWAKASRNAQRSSMGRDLSRSAWCIRVALQDFESDSSQARRNSTIPPALSDFLQTISEDGDAALKLGARGIDTQLKALAREIYGPPRFIPFTP